MELVPHDDPSKPVSEVFYMSMHVVYKRSSSTTRMRAVFDGMKILLQRIWELFVNWDDPIPDCILPIWNQWRSELSQLVGISILRCHYPKNAVIVTFQAHGFSDALENAFAGAA